MLDCVVIFITRTTTTSTFNWFSLLFSSIPFYLRLLSSSSLINLFQPKCRTCRTGLSGNTLWPRALRCYRRRSLGHNTLGGRWQETGYFIRQGSHWGS